MSLREETPEEHRARDNKTWGVGALLAALFPGLRGIFVLVVLATACAWGFNMLGESTALNSPDIYYSGIDARTGRQVTVKGCRPERLLPDGGCDKSISWGSARATLPYLGEPRKVSTPAP